MKVILHKLFPYAPYLNEYIGFEDEVGEMESGLEAVKRLRLLAEQAHCERYPHLYTENGVPVIIQAVPEQQMEKSAPVSMEDAINSCTDLTVLSTYKLLVKGKPYLQDVFDKKIIELSK